MIWRLAAFSIAFPLIVLVGLKLIGLSQWPWSWVLAPVWVPGAVFMAHEMLCGLIIIVILACDAWVRD